MPVFLPNLEGDSLAILASNLINAVYLTYISLIEELMILFLYKYSVALYLDGSNPYI
jgi:hypothetical protein